MGFDRSPQRAVDPERPVIYGRNVRLIEKVRRSVFTEVDAGIIAHVNPTRAVTIDGIARDICRRKPEDPDAIAPVASDGVAHNRGVRGLSYCNPPVSVVLNGVGTGS